MELKAGMYIAQGPCTNVLLLLGGEPPMLEVIKGIDLNAFKQFGKVRELDKLSPEVVDIMTNPKDYNFALPSITETIEAEGLGSTEFGSVENIDKKERNKMVEDGLSYYKDILPIYGLEQSKIKTKLYLLKEYNLKMPQANFIFSLIAKICNKPIV